jgi:hypothetical protein
MSSHTRSSFCQILAQSQSNRPQSFVRLYVECSINTFSAVLSSSTRLESFLASALCIHRPRNVVFYVTKNVFDVLTVYWYCISPHLAQPLWLRQRMNLLSFFIWMTAGFRSYVETSKSAQLAILGCWLHITRHQNLIGERPSIWIAAGKGCIHLAMGATERKLGPTLRVTGTSKVSIT